LDHAESIRRVHDDLEPTVVLAWRDGAAVDPEEPSGLAQLDLERHAAPVRGRRAPRPERLRAAADERPGVLGAERAPAREEAHCLEQRRLALRVAAQEHVQPRAELEPGRTNVA
jgi:hypothetical protein